MSQRHTALVRLFVLALPLFLVSPIHASWLPDVRLTVNDSSSLMSLNNAHCIAAGSAGDLHVVWFDTRDGEKEIYYKRSTDWGTTWSQDTRLSASGPADYPSVCVSGINVHVVWLNDNEGVIHYKHSTNMGASWLPDTVISARTNWTAAGGYPVITAEGSAVYAVWVSHYQYLATLYISFNRSMDKGSTWAGETALTDSTLLNDRAEEPSVSASDSVVHFTWKVFDNTTGANIYYKRSTDKGTTWSLDTCLLPPYGANDPSQACSDTLVHVVWNDAHDNGQIYYMRSTDRGVSWLPGTPLTEGTGWVGWPSIAASGLNVHAIWGASHGGQGIDLYYKHSTDGGATWSTGTLLTTDPTSWGNLHPSVAVGDTMVHLVWQDGRDGNPEIYYKRNPNGNAEGVEASPGEKGPEKRPGLRAVPNPFVSYATLPGREKEDFTLYDISGRKVGTFKGDRIGQGLGAGVYFLRPESGEVKPLRLVKVK